MALFPIICGHRNNEVKFSSTKGHRRKLNKSSHEQLSNLKGDNKKKLCLDQHRCDSATATLTTGSSTTENRSLSSITTTSSALPLLGDLSNESSPTIPATYSPPVLGDLEPNVHKNTNQLQNYSKCDSDVSQSDSKIGACHLTCTDKENINVQKPQAPVDVYSDKSNEHLSPSSGIEHVDSASHPMKNNPVSILNLDFLKDDQLDHDQNDSDFVTIPTMSPYFDNDSWESLSELHSYPEKNDLDEIDGNSFSNSTFAESSNTFDMSQEIGSILKKIKSSLDLSPIENLECNNKEEKIDDELLESSSIKHEEVIRSNLSVGGDITTVSASTALSFDVWEFMEDEEDVFNEKSISASLAITPIHEEEEEEDEEEEEGDTSKALESPNDTPEISKPEYMKTDYIVNVTNNSAIHKNRIKQHTPGILDANAIHGTEELSSSCHTHDANLETNATAPNTCNIEQHSHPMKYRIRNNTDFHHKKSCDYSTASGDDMSLRSTESAAESISHMVSILKAESIRRRKRINKLLQKE